jgi:hypothetical protein
MWFSMKARWCSKSSEDLVRSTRDGILEVNSTSTIIPFSVMVDDDWWMKAKDRSSITLLQIKSSSANCPRGKVVVFFGNGIYGRIPPRDANIRIYYTITTGFQGNSSSTGDDAALLDTILIGPNRNLRGRRHLSHPCIWR